ncbi:hypothetical protein BCR33DRAFT_720533 [Rhizoclosmatium globosum]|uniref:Uncharacterized protein n=1 Tax=Rhizoclosmatium globosum TaxID=329046 RepID=A0A1Y2BVX1_9FUNG|nr:hypothetical protein BCR33DRAFT_720533 [Rhizoclosmatium globosum]|eukprot:ORY38883.1 hypothetical protein BCR33DRAFT_720533 [Rhizoclosmatium globosum]
MSSNNEHRPRPAMKRSINFVAAETPFPPHSGVLSLSQVVEFAHQSQTAINRTFAITERAKRRKGASNLVLDHILPALDDPRTSFSLPLVTPHRLNQRFAVAQDNSVFTVFRKSYTALKTAFLEMDTDIYLGFLLRGPVGVGKSHILYILVAEYRLLRSMYRVTYIHDCAEWKSDKFGYILRELVMTFFDDKDISGKDIVEWCSAIVESDKEEKMMMMLNALIVYIQTKNLQWIIVCDQYNAFYSRSVVVDQFPFTIIDYLSKKRGSNIKVIISASANNEGYPTELRNWFTHDIASHKFDDDEFGAWCKYFPLKSGKTIDPKSDEALDALYWTGGVPYELFLLWAQPEASLGDKTRKYRKNRMIEMGSSHGKFCDTLTAEKMLNLKECIARMVIGLPCPGLLVGIDHQLFDVTLQPKRGRSNEFLNPVARSTLLNYYGQGLLSPLALVTELILKGDYYTQDIKSQISAKYLIATMEVSKKFSFEYNVKTQTGLSKNATRKQSVELLEIVRFIGHKVPPTASFNPNRSTLFVPESVNYPGYDFFIWNSKTKTISAFQVTIRNPFYNHAKIDSTSAQQNCAHWMTYCSAKSSEVYWVTPKSCLGGKSKKAEGNLVVLFESISKHYPALEHLTV